MQVKHALTAAPESVSVDPGELDKAVQDFVLDAALTITGMQVASGHTLVITVSGNALPVEVASVVLAPDQVRRVALRTSNTWPQDEDPLLIVSSTYFLCERSASGWTVRQMRYFYTGDDRTIDWFDLPIASEPQD